MATGYGVDVSCLDELETGRLVRGVELVAQAAYRRLITPRGMLGGSDDAVAYGIDLAGYVGAIGYDASVRALPGIIRNELLKDDRIADVSAKVTATRTGPATTLVVEIHCALYDAGENFTLTLSVSDVSSKLLGIA
jgi:hypothetical protein